MLENISISNVPALTMFDACVETPEDAPGRGKDEFSGVSVELVLCEAPVDATLPLGEQLLLLAHLAPEGRDHLEKRKINSLDASV